MWQAILSLRHLKLLILFLISDKSVKTYNSPRIGRKNYIVLPVSPETANGEIGFLDMTPRMINEPEGEDSTSLQVCNIQKYFVKL